MEKEKQIIIIIEGTDSAGKSAIKKALEVKSNWKYIVLDRFTGSDIVYDKLYNRENRESTLLKLERNLLEIADVYLVYLDCNIKIQLNRLEEAGEDKEIIDKIQQAKKLFQEYLTKTSLKHIIIDTTVSTVDECVDKIIKFIEGGE